MAAKGEGERGMAAIGGEAGGALGFWPTLGRLPPLHLRP